MRVEALSWGRKQAMKSKIRKKLVKFASPQPLPWKNELQPILAVTQLSSASVLQSKIRAVGKPCKSEKLRKTAGLAR